MIVNRLSLELCLRNILLNILLLKDFISKYFF